MTMRLITVKSKQKNKRRVIVVTVLQQFTRLKFILLSIIPWEVGPV